MISKRMLTCGGALLVSLLAHVVLAEGNAPVVNEPEMWKDPSQSPEARAKDLVRRMTLEEKASQVLANTPAIPRLGIPAYSHRNECLHGVANGVATVFPAGDRHGGDI